MAAKDRTLAINSPNSGLVNNALSRARAAEYVRMSTEKQQYSTLNQRTKLQHYAETHNLQIVRSYADEGKSGLNISGRPELLRLLQDVESKAADFQFILVYDVSRWGRFQDVDESAYYEYMCRRAGIQVIYCAEPFENDGSPLAAIIKNIKRAMAGEYSRELSIKVSIGKARLAAMGFRQGGAAGFGFRRISVDKNGMKRSVLKIGERKSVPTDRVILVPGPPKEVQAVNQMFKWFVNEQLSRTQIAKRMNRAGWRNGLGRTWTEDAVREVLTNEKYIGNHVCNRISK